MFNMGWSEILVIGVVALVAIGPKELPGVLRMVGQWIGKARRMAGEFQGQFQQAMREAEIADVQQAFNDVTKDVTDIADGSIVTDVQKDIESALNLTPPEMPDPVQIDVPLAETSAEPPAETPASTPEAPSGNKAAS